MSQVPLPIHQGRQGKHLPGHSNFIEGRSELTADPFLLAQLQGTGLPVSRVPQGEPGYKERVEFGMTIGIYVDPATGERRETSKGIIHYGVDGIHIVPARP